MSECINYSGTLDANGYGRVSIKVGDHFHSMLAHRVAWAVATGRDPGGYVVMHTCDNRSCINFDHLLLGTQSDNIADMDSKDRRNNWNSELQFCKRGHPFDEENTYIVKATGHRRCKTCVRDRQRQLGREKAVAKRNTEAGKT